MPLQGFITFIREKGVVGLAVGFLMGGAVSKLVTALVEDLVSPFIGLALGKLGNLNEAALSIGTVSIKWGHFISTLIDFIVVAAVVYIGVKTLRLDRADKKSEPAA
jgi:large conductance mechanosensitive channel